VASWRDPHIWLELIDRYLVTAEHNNLQAVICVNKIDLVEDQAEFAAALQPYHDLGFPVLATSAVTGAGIAELRELLRGKTTVLAGMSGVGKSSLLSTVDPGLELHTNTVSEHSGEGRHTTTQVNRFPLAIGGTVIDTPGMREFGVAGITRRELEGYFPEIVTVSYKCQFNDCAHLNEPDCAVQAAVDAGQIAQSRYYSYTKIYANLPE
jgi:ribosome biogenesis GTPase / thiamine phosphate phosphatase